MRRRRSCGRSWGGWGMSDLEWPKYKLGELFEVQRESVTPGLTPDLEFFHHSLPAWDECGGPVVAKGAEIESNKTLVTNPCVLVSKLNPRKPRVSVIEHVGPERTHCASTEFICLRPLTAQSLPFWGYYFSASRFAQKLERYAIGSTNSHTRANPREPLKWTVSVPPLGEQEKIAQLLDTLDTQIRQTEALIAKLERIKQGLLTDLLTRGIDQNGQLRPTPDQAPHLYKDSPLGRIPREWDYVSWGWCTESWAMGPRFSAEKYTEDGNVATLRTTDMDAEGGIDHATMPIAKLDLRGLEQHILKIGDFVITRSGTCGICGVFHGHSLPVLPGAFLIRFRFIGSELDPEFMAILMNSHIGQPLVARNAEGGVQKNLRGTSLLKVMFGKPPVSEQLAIRSRVQAVNNEIARLENDSSKLKSQKAGLMDDLLTGRVRVTPLLDTADRMPA